MSYLGNRATDAGVYAAEATLEKTGYRKTTLRATLKINKIEISGLSLTDASYVYDGSRKKLNLTGAIPEGTTLSYEIGGVIGNGASDAGVYPVIATVSGKNFLPFTAEATLTVDRAEFDTTKFSFLPKTFEYDGNSHSITVSVRGGAFPEGVIVSYRGAGGIAGNEWTEVGSKTVTAEISGKNYKTLTLETILSIRSKEKRLFTYGEEGEVYFQNPLDGDKLYLASNGAVAKASNDEAKYFTSTELGVYYLSESLFSSGISRFSGGKSDVLFNARGAEYLTTDGTNLYYVVNTPASALKKETGIYRIAISELENGDAEPEAKRVTDRKASGLAYYNNALYFSDKDDGNRLYRVSASENDGFPELIYDAKVTEMTIYGNTLFFTRGLTTDRFAEGAAIYAFNLDLREERKLSFSKGKYLVPLGDYVYFVNTDMLTSTIFGDGVYATQISGSSWAEESAELLSGAKKVIGAEGNDRIYSLTSDGTYLYYYRTSTKHLYRVDPATGEETDLMESFAPPAETKIVLTPYGKIEAHGGYLYYTDLTDGGKLHRYDPATGADVRATACMAADFAFDGDVLYYAGFRLTNCDVYRADLATGATEKITADKGLNFAFSDDKIYYLNCKGKNTLNEMNKDGTEDRIVFDDKTVSDRPIVVRDGFVWFAADGFYRYDIASGAVSKIPNARPDEYRIASTGKIYYMNNPSNFAKSNTVSVLDLSSGTITDIFDLGKAGGARSFFEYDGNVWFFAKTGVANIETKLYRITENVAEEVAVPGLQGRYMDSAVVIDGKIWFLDVWFVADAAPLGSGKLLCFDPNTLEVTEK